ncbi:MAG: hypothetical protein IJB02_01230 [Oscillospiraceae bacterium]|nr:hypothetical protein [Oscillospiraceae bacterium]
MDISKLKFKITDWIQKYKYVLLVLIVGILFILIPTNKHSDMQESAIQKQETAHISQSTLKEILSRIKGAGRVEVLLSLEHSAGNEYQTDKDASATSAGRSTTVTVTDAQRNETGLVSKTIAPVYRGAIVVCDGADNPAVHLSIVNAVSNLTGLRSDQISVLKME